MGLRWPCSLRAPGVSSNRVSELSFLCGLRGCVLTILTEKRDSHTVTRLQEPCLCTERSKDWSEMWVCTAPELRIVEH